MKKSTANQAEESVNDADCQATETQQTGEGNGRDALGRFTSGNVGGPGNPFARRVARLRQVLIDSVTEEEMAIIAGQLVVQAKLGDQAAIKLLFQYVLGKPAAVVDPDALDQQEMELYQRNPPLGAVREVLGGRMPADLACDLVQKIGGTRIAAPPAGATNQAGMDPLVLAERYRALLEIGDKTGVVPMAEMWAHSKPLHRLGDAAFVAVESGHPKACVLADVFHLYKSGSDFTGLHLLERW